MIAAIEVIYHFPVFLLVIIRDVPSYIVMYIYIPFYLFRIIIFNNSLWKHVFYKNISCSSKFKQFNNYTNLKSFHTR